MQHHDWQMDFEAADTEEFVLVGDHAFAAGREPTYYLWRAAHVETGLAWDAWRERGDLPAYLAYQAALDREDAAQDALAADVRLRTVRTSRSADGELPAPCVRPQGR